MSDDLVVIATYFRPQIAGMAHGVLASAGITAVVNDDGIAGVAPHLVPVVGGVRLRVAAEDAEAARQVLEEQGLADDGSAAGAEPAAWDEAGPSDPVDESVRAFLRHRR
jgi:hypothetical protein